MSLISRKLEAHGGLWSVWCSSEDSKNVGWFKEKNSYLLITFACFPFTLFLNYPSNSWTLDSVDQTYCISMIKRINNSSQTSVSVSMHLCFPTQAWERWLRTMTPGIKRPFDRSLVPACVWRTCERAKRDADRGRVNQVKTAGEPPPSSPGLLVRPFASDPYNRLVCCFPWGLGIHSADIGMVSCSGCQGQWLISRTHTHTHTFTLHCLGVCLAFFFSSLMTFATSEKKKINAVCFLSSLSQVSLSVRNKCCGLFPVSLENFKVKVGWQLCGCNHMFTCQKTSVFEWA